MYDVCVVVLVLFKSDVQRTRITFLIAASWRLCSFSSWLILVRKSTWFTYCYLVALVFTGALKHMSKEAQRISSEICD